MGGCDLVWRWFGGCLSRFLLAVKQIVLILILDLLIRELLITVKLFATRACLKSSVGDVLKLWD